MVLQDLGDGEGLVTEVKGEWRGREAREERGLGPWCRGRSRVWECLLPVRGPCCHMREPGAVPGEGAAAEHKSKLQGTGTDTDTGKVRSTKYKLGTRAALEPGASPPPGWSGAASALSYIQDSPRQSETVIVSHTQP